MEIANETKMEVQALGLTPYEMQVIQDILNARTNVPGSIRDLRMVQNTVKAVIEQVPERPSAPVYRSLAEGETSYPKEELAEIEQKQKDYLDNLRTYFHGTEVSVVLSDASKLLIKQRLQNFHQFQTDAETRERVLKLAEKFGL